MTMNALPLAPCHHCGQIAVEVLSDFSRLKRVTSDCQPWPAGGEVGVCRACGGAQKLINARWLAEIEHIYANYAIYHQSGGVEQAVFAASGGQAQARSERLLECVQTHQSLPAAGRWLDLGCGNGALLRAASHRLAHWSLAGQEINDKYKSVVESISRVEALYVSEPEQVPGQFEAVSLVHVLEHIPEPAAYLKRLASKLAPGGVLLIEVPNHAENPFDLLIADHASHFTAATLAAVAERAGYSVLSVASDWVPKELTLVASLGAATASAPPNSEQALQTAKQHIAWLHSVAQAARLHSERHPFGLFGTSIAATWLFGELDGQVDFFVDEDPARAGKSHEGRPIYRPEESPLDSHIFLSLPSGLAQKLQARLSSINRHWVLPPP